jgi:hypothetical protein
MGAELSVLLMEQMPIGSAKDPSRHSSQIISRWTGHRVVSLCQGQCCDTMVNRRIYDGAAGVKAAELCFQDSSKEVSSS